MTRSNESFANDKIIPPRKILGIWKKSFECLYIRKNWRFVSKTKTDDLSFFLNFIQLPTRLKTLTPSILRYDSKNDRKKTRQFHVKFITRPENHPNAKIISYFDAQFPSRRLKISFYFRTHFNHLEITLLVSFAHCLEYISSKQDVEKSSSSSPNKTHKWN